MNINTLLERIGYNNELSVSMEEECLTFCCGESIVPRSLPKIFGSEGLGTQYRSLSEARKGTVSNQEGSKSSNDFIKTLQKLVHSEQDLVIRLKRSGLNCDKEKTRTLFGMLSDLEERGEWPVVIIPKLWEWYKIDLTKEEFDKRIQETVKKYAESSYKKGWVDGLKKLGFSYWNTRSWMLFDFYLPDLRVRIELDGSQHGDFPQHEIDQISDQYFSELYGIETWRFSGFGGKYYNPLIDYKKNEILIDDFLVFLYQRLERIEELGEGKRDLREDGAYMAVVSSWWRKEGLRKCVYPDDCFSRPDMKIGQIESPKNLIDEERAE